MRIVKSADTSDVKERFSHYQLGATHGVRGNLEIMQPGQVRLVEVAVLVVAVRNSIAHRCIKTHQQDHLPQLFLRAEHHFYCRQSHLLMTGQVDVSFDQRPRSLFP
jgi:hypothetical protein